MAQKTRRARKTREEHLRNEFPNFPPASREEILTEIAKGLREGFFARGDLAKFKAERTWNEVLHRVRKERLLPQDTLDAEIEAELEAMPLSKLKNEVAAASGMTRAEFDAAERVPDFLIAVSMLPSSKVKAFLEKLRRDHRRLLRQNK